MSDESQILAASWRLKQLRAVRTLSWPNRILDLFPSDFDHSVIRCCSCDQCWWQSLSIKLPCDRLLFFCQSLQKGKGRQSRVMCVGVSNPWYFPYQRLRSLFHAHAHVTAVFDTHPCSKCCCLLCCGFCWACWYCVRAPQIHCLAKPFRTNVPLYAFYFQIKPGNMSGCL